MTLKLAGRPFYYIWRKLPGFGSKKIKLSTGTKNKDRADAMESMLVEFATSRPALVRALLRKQFTLKELYVAKLRGPRSLRDLHRRAKDPLLSEIIEQYKPAVSDDRVVHGLNQLLELAPDVAKAMKAATPVRVSWLDHQAVTMLCAKAVANGQASGSVRRSLYRAISELLGHHFGVQKKAAILAGVTKKPKKSKPRDIRLASSEVKAALAACDEEFVLLAIVAMLTAQDRKPLLRQHVRDFSDEHGTIRVPDEKAPDRWRVLELSDTAWQAYRMATAGKKPSERIFEFTPSQVRTRWDAVKHEAKIPHVHFKDLRHVGATALEDSGANVKEIQGILGHGDPNTTLIYLGPQRSESTRPLFNAAAKQLGLDRFFVREVS